MLLERWGSNSKAIGEQLDNNCSPVAWIFTHCFTVALVYSIYMKVAFF